VALGRRWHTGFNWNDIFSAVGVFIVALKGCSSALGLGAFRLGAPLYKLECSGQDCPLHTVPLGGEDSRFLHFAMPFASLRARLRSE
jgi:hypothetical protein